MIQKISKSAIKFRAASILFWFSGAISIALGIIVGFLLQSLLTGLATFVIMLVLCELTAFWLAYDFALQDDTQI